MTSTVAHRASKISIPFLTDQQIEAAAARLRADFEQLNGCPSLPLDCQQVVWDLLDERERLSLDVESSLGFTPEGEQIAGLMSVESEGGWIRIDASVVDKPLFPFTLAHELGHWMLHRQLIMAARMQANLYSLSNAPWVTLYRSLDSFHGRLPPEEWQANRFATHLLMPSDVVRREFMLRFGVPVEIDLDAPDVQASWPGLPANVRLASRVLADAEVGEGPTLTQLLGVSREAVAIRLEELHCVSLRSPQMRLL